MLLPDKNNANYTVICNEALIRSFQRERFLKQRREQIVRDVNFLMVNSEYDLAEIFGAYGATQAMEGFIEAFGMEGILEELVHYAKENSLLHHLDTSFDEAMRRV